MSDGGHGAAELIAHVKRFGEARIWVIGDVMLDEYVAGAVERISPEAPVPVVHVAKRFSRLGGAANVARSIQVLGAQVRLCGVVGTDGTGDEFFRLCEETGIDTAAVGRVDDRQTTRKIRVLGPSQQLLRLDWEPRDPCAEDLLRSLVERLARGPSPTAVVLSDYGKGVVTPASARATIEAARERQVPVLVCPHGIDYSIYRGATLLKPNLRELEEATGRSLRDLPDNELIKVARQVLETVEVETVVLTLGERGMLVVPRDGEAMVITAQPRQVYDVTGAGDTVIAVLAMALSIGVEVADASRIANSAASLVIREVGAAVVESDRLMAELGANTKALSWRTLGNQIASWRLQGKRIALTNGCFDIMHVGHILYLEKARSLGDVLVVGLNSDTSVRRLKGPERPLVPENERVAVLQALKFVDTVVVFEEDTPLELIQLVRPDVLVKGADYSIDQVVGRELVEAAGGKVVLVPLFAGYSTSKLIDRIRNGRGGAGPPTPDEPGLTNSG